MEFMKKQSAGFYLGTLTIILSIIGTVLYLGNCRTAYFTNLGVNTTVVACLIAAIVCEAVFLAGNEAVGSKMILDILPVASAVLLAVAVVTFVSTRVNGIAAIMTFTNNASTMADLNNTITAIAFCAVSLILCIVTSFFRVVKEQ